jgi:hypothetical protein
LRYDTLEASVGIMNNPLKLTSWSPFAVGAGIGMLSWFAFATADHPIGITTAFEHSAALGLKDALKGQTSQPDYYAAKTLEGKPPKIGWEWMLVVGVFVGALLSSWSSGDRSRVTVPSLWRWRFGGSSAKRLSVAFIAGALMMFGARLAQGCTSGHGISGTLQLALSSWVFILLAFGVAVATAFLVYGREGRQHV